MSRNFKAILRGLTRRCPSCGTGRIFSGYMKLKQECPSCGISFAGIRTDDAAPWATILFVGHLAGSFIALTIHSDIPLYTLTGGILMIVLMGCAATLPIMKGIFVNLNWSLGVRYPETKPS